MVTHLFGSVMIDCKRNVCMLVTCESGQIESVACS